MRELHLFAGIGGGILGGILLGHRCVGAVEVDPYCRDVLRARQRECCLPEFPIYGDILEFDGRPWRGRVDVVCGGFPCQPWSSAGKRLGAADPRHLWPAMARVVSEVCPAFVFAENVSMAAFAEPWRDLRAMGYHVPPAIQVSAGDVGAPYKRNRWWLLAADADRMRQLVLAVDEKVAGASTAGDADGSRLAQQQDERGDVEARSVTASERATRWHSQHRLRRLVSGPPARLDARRNRIRAAGNCQVPIVAATAFRYLMAQLPTQQELA